jgi:predicted NUDIX family NTP pyrophosphohydrolase
MNTHNHITAEQRSPSRRLAVARESAGLVLYRKQGDGLHVLLGHMGGPLHSHKDAGAWTIPKGTPETGETLLDAALREFEEEVGLRPKGDPWLLAPIVQHSGKRVHAWAMEADIDPARFRSNRFALEWPPRSGTTQYYPELDRIAWFTIADACKLAVRGQADLFLEVERRSDSYSA